jgi:UDP-N-acetylmuramate dehydrogenase
MLEIREQVPLLPMTTFKIGGPARFYTEVESEEEIREAVLWARAKSIPFVILAGGSNVLMSDSGLEALVIRMVAKKHSFEGSKLSADAGCVLLELIKQASLLGLGGWEKLAGIPGTVGGAVRGNAGAFGTEIKDVIESVHAFNAMSLETRRFMADECGFAYRQSFFKLNPEWIILSVTIALRKVSAGDSIAQIDTTIIERERRHLQNVQAAGSYFKNPVAPEHVQRQFEGEKGAEAREGRVPAGWLIEKVGMKGAKVGGAMASEQHPNYLVNMGTATSADVCELADQIKSKVYAQFGIRLEEEAAVLA